MLPTPSDEIIDSLPKLDEITQPVRNTQLFQLRASFAVAIVLVLTGAALMVWAVLEQGTVKNAKIVVGVLTGTLGSFVLKLHNSARTDVRRSNDNRQAMHMICLMTDPAARDRAIDDFRRTLQEDRRGFFRRLFGKS